MKLQHLFEPFPQFKAENFFDLEVRGIFSDARQCVKDSAFVAIRGNVADGHQYLEQAIHAGARVLVVEDASRVPPAFDGAVVVVPHSREALDVLAGRYYGDPGQELFAVGVTGTNGKTSITYMVESILNRAHRPTGVIGTINHHLEKKVWPSSMTTPDPVSLQKRLHEFRNDGAMAVAIEVSSHALHQHRVDSVPFDAVIFTNLTRDHLDYHKDMEDYFAAKQRLFNELMWRTTKRPSYAIINTDDKYGRRLKVADSTTIWRYGSQSAELEFKIKKMDFSLTHFSLRTPMGKADVFLPMSGLHNVQNATAAIGAGLAAGVPLVDCALAMNLFAGVPGRLQVVPNRHKFSVFVDYAHSPDALKNVLSALVEIREKLGKSSRIWLIFGCGGDRDQGKRPLMMQMALRYADQVMVTSDNPRTEDPQKIMSDILSVVSGGDSSRVQSEVDRRVALQKVLSAATPDDVVLIAGKGHEDYQIIGTDKLPFSDYEIAQEVLESV